MVSCILPRPIALVSTISTDGVGNLAPFSFFNGVAANPPTVVFAPAADRTGREKDTVNNLNQVGECVVNVVPYGIAEAMNASSYAFAPEIDELEAVGFTALPGTRVRPVRVAESPVQMECRLDRIVKLGQGPLSGNICICEVLCFHIAAEVCLPDGTADAAKLDLIGRLGGAGYSTIRDRFDLPKPQTPPS
ncbi:MAG: flavin reductase family protein [bacterium]|nr:flavin reductase family protein [bacterium]